MAENAADSFHKGQPVIVTGRYYSREYEQNEQIRVAYELEANAVGHDLSRGTSEFRKVTRPNVANQVEVDEQGLPADASDQWLDLDEPDQDAPESLEARELAPVA
jgi:single-strand DNA-binding protein